MTLEIEAIKIPPSLLQEFVERGDSVIMYCNIIVPKNIQKKKTFKLDLQSIKLKCNVTNVNKWLNHSDCSIFKPVIKKEEKLYSIYNTILNFPINKVIRGIHPSTLKCHDFMTTTNIDQWQDQLASWISIYDTELSTYYDEEDFDTLTELLNCNFKKKGPMILIETKRTFKDIYVANDKDSQEKCQEYIEYLYYLTYKEDYNKADMVDAFLNYSMEFNNLIKDEVIDLSKQIDHDVYIQSYKEKEIIIL